MSAREEPRVAPLSQLVVAMETSAERELPATESADLWKGAAAGLVGGLVASFVMNRAQEAWTIVAVGPARARFHFEQGGQIKKSARHRPFSFEKSESATSRMANAVSRLLLGRRIGGKKRRRAGTALHDALGAGVGASYGAAAEAGPEASAGRGLPFGAVVWLVADELAMPLLGLAKPPNRYPVAAHAQSLGAHLVFGWATEAVRRRARKNL